MKYFRLFMIVCTVIIACINHTACTSEPDIVITDMYINEARFGNKINVYVGEYGELHVTNNGSWVADYVPNYTWSSSNISVVDIDKKTGRYEAKSVGECTITVVNEDVQMSVQCTIVVKPIEISMDPSQKTMKVGQETALSVIYTPENTPYRDVVWYSSDTNIATVNDNGKVVAVGVGECDICAKLSFGQGNQIATCKITVETTEVEGISLNYTTKTLHVGENFVLTAKLTPETATNKDVIWYSSNTAIATVDNDGKVTAIKEGKCNIVAKTHNGKTATCAVTVNPIEVESISLNINEKTLAIGEYFTLTASVYPANATSKNVVWSSSNTAIASVDNNGKVTAIKEGKCNIVAKANNGKTATCIVTVNSIEVESISLNINEKTLAIGEDYTLTASVYPANATSKNVIWSSSNTAIATVDNNGKVTAIKEGKCNIVAKTDNGKTATCAITVNLIEVESISLNLNEKTLAIGEDFTLTASVYPTNASYQDVVWSSSNTNIATVDNNGTVTAVKEGECIIYAKSTNNKKASCRVIVKPISVQSVSLNKTSIMMLIGESKKIDYTITPSNAKVSDVKWHVEDESIATVSDDGTVTCKAIGSTNVTVTINGEYTAECKITGSSIENFVSLRFTSSAVTSINGYITGSIGCVITNSSSQEIIVKSIQLIDSKTGAAGNEMDANNQVVAPNSSIGYTITIRYSIFKPIFRWKYVHNGKEYTIDIKYDI